MQKQVTELTQKIEAITDNNRKLKAQVKDLKEGMGMIEERARMELDMVKSNEILVQYKK